MQGISDDNNVHIVVIKCKESLTDEWKDQEWLKPRADVTRSPKQGCQWNPGQTSPEVQNRGISETQGRRHQKSKTGVSVKPRADVTRSPKQGYQWNPGQTSPEVQNRAISSPTKRTCVLQKFLKKWLCSFTRGLNSTVTRTQFQLSCLGIVLGFLPVGIDPYCNHHD